MNARTLIPTDDPKYHRDGPYGPVLNTDTEGLQQYKKQRAESIALKQTVADVATLKQDILEIKELLRKLVSNG